MTLAESACSEIPHFLSDAQRALSVQRRRGEDDEGVEVEAQAAQREGQASDEGHPHAL